MSAYDFVFVLDYNSLLSGKLFSIYDIEQSQIRILTPEIKKLNKLIVDTTDQSLKQSYIDIVSKINSLADNKQLFFLGEESDEGIDYKLLEIIVKNFYLKNILIISNDEERIRKFLPLTTIYETFNKQLDIGFIDKKLNFYEYSQAADALKCINEAEYNYDLDETFEEKNEDGGETDE